MADPNIELLAQVAEALGNLRDRFVFVGGCATALLFSDPAAPPARVTHDVDVVAAVVSIADYHRLGGLLRARGFTQTLEDGEPPYRWTYTGMKLDVMPSSETVFGFSNRWYEAVMRSAIDIELRKDLSIRVITSVYFVATKLEAFDDRGQGDYLMSHDLEDILSVVDGRPELVQEFAQADAEVREYVAGVFARLISKEEFLNALPGLIVEGSPATRSPLVIERLRQIAGL
jgi:predicted nucleotidyltransferase